MQKIALHHRNLILLHILGQREINFALRFIKGVQLHFGRSGFLSFFGIFRSVKLKAKPCVHVEDIFIRLILWNSNIQGNLEVNAKLSMVYAKDIRVTAVLRDKGKICWSQDMKMQYSDKGTSNILQVTGALKDTLPISITPWDHHKPYLYDFCLEVKRSGIIV